MANFGKYTRRGFETLLENDITVARDDCDHPERAGESYCDFYCSSFNDVQPLRYCFGTGDENRENFIGVCSARIDERLQELGQRPMNRKDVKYATSLILTLPQQVPPQDEKKFFDAYQAFCEQYFGTDNMYCYAVHYHENRPHAQCYAMPVVNGRMDNNGFHRRQRYREIHQLLQEYMDKAMGYHIEVVLDDDNPKKKTSNKSINALYRAEIKKLKKQNAALEAERKYWLKRTQSAEAVQNVLQRAGMLDKVKSSIEDSDRLTEAELNTQYEYYHNQRVAAGRARSRKQNEL